MSEHLPECWAKFPSDPEAWCICEELRFCEDRVSAAAVQRVEALHERYLFGKREYAALISAIKGDQQ